MRPLNLLSQIHCLSLNENWFVFPVRSLGIRIFSVNGLAIGGRSGRRRELCYHLVLNKHKLLIFRFDGIAENGHFAKVRYV